MGAITKFAFGVFQALGGGTEQEPAHYGTPESTDRETEETEAHTWPIVDLTQDLTPSSYLPTHFKTENDNIVTRTNPYAFNRDCSDGGVVSVGRPFVGPHSLTHTLRFAAWLVKTADKSPDYEGLLQGPQRRHRRGLGKVERAG